MTKLNPHDALGLAPPAAHQRAPQASGETELSAALAALLPQVPPPPALLSRLRQRVSASQAANAPFHTLRRPLQQAPQAGWPAGVQAQALHGDSWLLTLEAGCALPTGDGALELLVLDGELDDGSGQPPLKRLGYLLGLAAQPLRAQTRCRVYLRRHANGPYRAPAQAQRLAEPAWQPLRDGVQIAPLFGDGERYTLLARFSSGARVPAHAHGVDEECLMVEGELFLGDVLLPEGGYQFAPAGSQHGDLFADSDCLLFFHGAIDAAAVDNTHRAQQGWPAL